MIFFQFVKLLLLLLLLFLLSLSLSLEIVFTRAAPAFDNLFMGYVFNINTVHKTIEKSTFQAFH